MMAPKGQTGDFFGFSAALRSTQIVGGEIPSRRGPKAEEIEKSMNSAGNDLHVTKMPRRKIRARSRRRISTVRRPPAASPLGHDGFATAV